MQNNLVVGMLAHVDAGKTTLAEGLLFQGGGLRRLGRVDHRDAFLDTDAMERSRGITIFSKQAVLSMEGATLTLLDTPGHVDFSAEMERTLQVLDCAVLVISGTDGVQGHTGTLWNLLERYNIPTFLFVNKMDLAGADPAALLSQLQGRLHGGCVAFSGRAEEALHEDIAVCGEEALQQFLERGRLEDDTVCDLVGRRLLFPVFFGSALKLEGVEALLRGLVRYARPPVYGDEFAAKVYKITRDTQGGRLTHLKVTGGHLAVKSPLTGYRPDSPEEPWTEKVNQIRVYSGEKYRAVDDVPAGTICAVTGLSHTYPGQGLGAQPQSPPPALQPVLAYRVVLPPGCEPHGALRRLRLLEEEDPQLALSWTEQTGEIHLHLMGEIQLEILRQAISERFGMDIAFDAGRILYRETISRPVIGMGHFEPLRHYAEVHLLLEPGPRGSGLHFDTLCSEDTLSRSWQRLVLTHLRERRHPGVLTGAPVTDMKITLLAGRAHLKHTEGGDFRQATFRALRQGLMQAESVLLEPWYRFRLEVPAEAVGRAMTDLQRVSDDLALPEGDGERAVLAGSAPVAALRDYAAQVTAYTRGQGRLTCTFSGYAPCHNQAQAVADSGYDADRDTENPADSVFCDHGAGVVVPWNRAGERMHLDSGQFLKRGTDEPPGDTRPRKGTNPQRPADSLERDRELQAIFEQTYGPVKRRDFFQPPPQAVTAAAGDGTALLQEGVEYLLVDGYNIIHAWDDLRAVALDNMDAARQILMDILSNYRGYRGREIVLVFDAYKVPGGERRVERHHNISVVYTKEAETADAYIEKVTTQVGKKHRVTVATSDGAIQMIIWGHGALRISPQALRAEIEQTNADIAAALQSINRHGFSPSIRFPE